jgi:hypothetical protein
MSYTVTEKSTMHGLKTPHGYKTPHRMPVSQTQSLGVFFSELSSQLYPTGRAFYMPKNGVMDNFHQAINRSFIRLIEDCYSTLDSVFPDNKNFSLEDCELWEYRFGLISNDALTLEERRSAILRKMSRGRNNKPRQDKYYIENQLQLAGFDVYVHENRFFEGGQWVYKSPSDIVAGSANQVQHGLDFQHGVGAQHGASDSQLIANSINPDETFIVSNLWASFFIGGQVLGDSATIPASREVEFRELVLKLKPAHLVAYTFIDYI